MIQYREAYQECVYSVCVRQYEERAHLRVQVRATTTTLVAFHDGQRLEILLPGVRSTDLLAHASRRIDHVATPLTDWRTFLAVHAGRAGFIADRWYAAPRVSEEALRHALLKQDDRAG
jgi:hypothetical protein